MVTKLGFSLLFYLLFITAEGRKIQTTDFVVINSFTRMLIELGMV